MKRVLTATVLALAATGAFGTLAPAFAEPEPSLVAPKGTFELDFKQYAPERLEVMDKGKKVTYWYIRYTVTNNSGKDVIFTPEFELITDTGSAVQGFKGVNRDIYFQLKKLYGNKLMESPFEILGKLLQGADNARDGIAIFRDVDPDSRVFTFYVQGVANETQKVKNPIKGNMVTLSKTLQIDYKMPGEQIDVDPKPEFKGKKWVMKENRE